MKCPIIPAVSYSSLDELTVKRGDCLKEECAWWDEQGDICSIQTIGDMLAGLVDTLGEIVNKMPHEEQFRK